MFKHIAAVREHCSMLAYFSLPYTVEFLGVELSSKLGLRDSMPPRTPRKSWLEHGSSIKTAASFRENVAGIIDLASSKGERVLLMTFAHYVSTGIECKV